MGALSCARELSIQSPNMLRLSTRIVLLFLFFIYKSEREARVRTKERGKHAGCVLDWHKTYIASLRHVVSHLPSTQIRCNARYNGSANTVVRIQWDLNGVVGFKGRF